VAAVAAEAGARREVTPVRDEYGLQDGSGQAMTSYKVNKTVRLQLNVYNLFDRFQVGTLNNGGARATIGLPRSAQLTANVLF
jgi:outer membrane receptor for monomeric catechols